MKNATTPTSTTAEMAISHAVCGVISMILLPFSIDDRHLERCRELQPRAQRTGDLDATVGRDAQYVFDVETARVFAPLFSREIRRLARRIRQRAGTGARGDQDGERLRAVRRLTGARVEQVRIALAIHLEEALVVARGADRLAVVERQRRQRRRLARMLDADAPGLVALLAERDDVAADVDQRVRHPLRAQDRGGAVERITLRVAAEVDLHRRVAAGHPIVLDD